jgi:hypothetical protein
MAKDYAHSSLSKRRKTVLSPPVSKACDLAGTSHPIACRLVIRVASEAYAKPSPTAFIARGVSLVAVFWLSLEALACVREMNGVGFFRFGVKRV